jgi:hypothetical protein
LPPLEEHETSYFAASARILKFFFDFIEVQIDAFNLKEKKARIINKRVIVLFRVN